jgi:hypothetical protein
MMFGKLVNSSIVFLQAVDFVLDKGPVELHRQAKHYVWALPSVGQDVRNNSATLYGMAEGLLSRTGIEGTEKNRIERELKFYYEDLQRSAEVLQTLGEKYE